MSEPPITESQIDDFWTRTLDELSHQPMEAQVETAPDNVPFQLFHITCRSLGGVQIRAKLARPIDVGNPKHKYPAIVSSPGYSGVAFGESLSDCQRGYIILQVYPRMQGESAQFMSPDVNLGGNWLLYGTDDPQRYYYRGAFADLARGIDYLLTRDDVDGQRIGAMGSSQGGFLSLGIAGIDPRVRAVVAHVPFLCNLRHNPCFDPAGGPDTYWGNWKAMQDPKLVNTFDYFDPVHLAHRMAMPVALSSGGRDKICPASSIRAVYDRLPGIRSLTHFPTLGHDPSSEFFAMGWNWMRTYLKEC